MTEFPYILYISNPLDIYIIFPYISIYLFCNPKIQMAKKTITCNQKMTHSQPNGKLLVFVFKPLVFCDLRLQLV